MTDTRAKQQLEESLSALMDGEISELELRRLLKASDEDYAELRDSWAASQMASSAMKKDVPAIDLRDLSASISAAIDEEPAHSTNSVDSKKENTKASKQSLWSGVGRFAIAASVAGAVVLGVQFSPNSFDGQVAEIEPTQVQPAQVPSSFGHGLPVDTTVSTVSSENTVNQVPQKQTIILNESTQKQLQQAEQQVGRFMLEHAQNASQNTQQGVLPYARVPEASNEQ